jgi:predicted Zn finger-like uncharacterized protein
MILTCPSCTTRYQVDEAKFPPAGRQVRCAKCGQTWHQPGPVPEEPVAEPEIATPAPQTLPEAPPYQQETAPAAPMRGSAAPVQEEARLGWVAALGVTAGWVGLLGVVLLIGLAAVRYRQEITEVWPQSAGVYSSLGMNANAHGIDFTHVNSRRESQNGQVVLAVTGAIVNNGDRELPVPQTAIVTLSDASNHELYHWVFKPGAQTLQPKQSIPFFTRLSSPPAAARRLEVRFAADGK